MSSKLKGLKVGDLVFYRIRPSHKDDRWKWSKVNQESGPVGAIVVDRRRHGLIVALDLETAMGFQMVRVLWNDTTEIDIIAENYLHKVSGGGNGF